MYPHMYVTVHVILTYIIRHILQKHLLEKWLYLDIILCWMIIYVIRFNYRDRTICGKQHA